MTATVPTDAIRLDVERARVRANTGRVAAGYPTGICVECGDEMRIGPTPTGARLDHLNGRTDHPARLWVQVAGKPYAPEPKDAAAGQDCRTLCQHPGCGVEIEQVIGSDEWVHIDSANPDHWATPVGPTPPTPTRQMLTHPSSLVDYLREWGRFHGVTPVTTPEAYRAAEHAAGLLQQIVFGGAR
jgi:hypothetical protein